MEILHSLGLCLCKRPARCQLQRTPSRAIVIFAVNLGTGRRNVPSATLLDVVTHRPSVPVVAMQVEAVEAGMVEVDVAVVDVPALVEEARPHGVRLSLAHQILTR